MGSVMEELGHPDSAMHYYKTAEATAAPDYYYNLMGQPVGKNLPSLPGIYIHHGNKILVR